MKKLQVYFLQVLHCMYENPLDSLIKKSCRAITGCLKPAHVEDLYLLDGMAPSDIRRNVCSNGNNQYINSSN